MNLRDFRKFLPSFLSLLFILAFVYWNNQEQKPPAFSFTVGIPKAFDPKFTGEELIKYRHSGGSATPISILELQSMPHDDSFLYVSLEKNGTIKLNQEVFGSLDDPKPLSEKLNEIFTSRMELGVFEANSNKIVKALIVKATRSEKYDNVVKIVDVAKSSGAEPIVLQIDGLPK